MEENSKPQWTQDIQELYVLPFPIKEEKLSWDDETNSKSSQQEKSSKCAQNSSIKFAGLFSCSAKGLLGKRF